MEELNKRKRVYNSIKILGFILTFLGMGLMFYWTKPDNKIAIYLVMSIGAVPGVLVLLYCKNKIKAISTEFKLKYIKCEIESRIPDATYTPNSGISETVVELSNLIKLHTKYMTEDLIRGHIKDVSFRCADVHVQQLTSDGDTVTMETTFQGRFYEFDFPKNFLSNIVLLQPKRWKPDNNLRRIKMESIDFNLSYKVFTSDDHDTFYILTPQLMEKLRVLDKKYNDKIGFSFLNSKLYIAVDSREDTFDVTGFKDISNLDVKKAIEEIENMIEFVEYLQLDKDLFKKN